MIFHYSQILSITFFIHKAYILCEQIFILGTDEGVYPPIEWVDP